MKIIVSNESYSRVSKYFSEVNIKVDVINIKNLKIKENEIYINLYSDKKGIDFKKMLNTKGTKIYNYTNNFNKRTIKELFRMRSNKIVNRSIEFFSKSDCKYFSKLLKYNPNILFAKLSYDKKGRLVKINGIEDSDITESFLNKLKDVLVDV